MAENKLEAVVVAIGTDIKNLRKAINDKESSAGITEKQLNEAIQRAKSDILGDGVPENLDTLKEIADKIATLNCDTSGAIVVKLTELGQKIDSIEKLEWLKSYGSWVAIFEELKGSEIGAPIVNLPFYIVRDKQTNSLFFKGLDRPPFFKDPETGKIEWTGPFEWEYQINSQTVLGFYMQQFTEKEEWNDYNNSLNKEQGLERTIVSKNINEDDEIATNGLWYVDDDGHFQRLVDTIIELKKEVAELKGKQNHE